MYLLCLFVITCPNTFVCLTAPESRDAKRIGVPWDAACYEAIVRASIAANEVKRAQHWFIEMRRDWSVTPTESIFELMDGLYEAEGMGAEKLKLKKDAEFLL